MRRASIAWMCNAAALLAVSGAAAVAQQQQPATVARAAGAGGRGRGTPIGVQAAPHGDGPLLFDSAEQHKVRVVVVTKGLANPWSFAFLPDGSILVTERGGTLRIIR